MSDLNQKNAQGSTGDSSNEQPLVPSKMGSIHLLPGINSSTQAAFNIAGTCMNVPQIEIRINNLSIGTANCISGYWSLVSDVSSYGDGILSVEIFDYQSAILLASQNVVKDILAPTASLLSPPSGASNSTSISSPISTVDTVEYSYKIGESVSTDCSLSAGYSGYISSSINISNDISSVVDGAIKLCVVAKDAVGNIQSYTLASEYLWIKDTVVPTSVTGVVDGDQIVSTNYSSLIAWEASSDAGSGVFGYEVRIVNSSDVQVVDWISVGNILTYGFVGLSLPEGQTYKAEVRAVDNAGNRSVLTQGDGWYVVPQGWKQQAYIKAVNSGAMDGFGWSVDISGDTLVVSAEGEDSNQTTITNGTTASSNNSSIDSGAVYVYRRVGTSWTQEAFIKAPNSGAGERFGRSVAIDLDTIIVGADLEDSSQTTITNGTTASSDFMAPWSGAAYVFKRTGVNWVQEAYIKAPNAEDNDHFGISVDINGDTAVVGAAYESSNQTTITNGTTANSNNLAMYSGAAYVFKRTGTVWAQQAYLKPPNAESNDKFGYSVSISMDTVAVSAIHEDSNQTTVTNGASASSDNSAVDSGAVYIFKRTGTAWSQEAYLKPSNIDAGDQFGQSVSIHLDTIAVGSIYEDSNQTTVTNGTTASSNNSASGSGAVYIFKRIGAAWVQEAYLKASNADVSDGFGESVALYEDVVAIGAPSEGSSQTTITNGTAASADNSAALSGAVYIFKRASTGWAQEAYLKAPNAYASDYFGKSVSVSGNTVAVGAVSEDSNQTTITNGATASSDRSLASSGAVYVFNVDRSSLFTQQAYLKAINSDAGDNYGNSVAIYGDTMVVGAWHEASSQATITNGSTASSDNSVISGAAYVYKRSGSNWIQEAYLKPPNPDLNDGFGYSVAVSGDTIAVGAWREGSGQTTITNGPTASSDNSVGESGAVYVYKRNGSNWVQEAYLKAPNAGLQDQFGVSVSISGDTIAVGAYYERSNQTTITNGTSASSNDSVIQAGAVYIFKRTDTNWAQEAYIKAPNLNMNDWFGYSVSLSGDTAIVGAMNESSNQTTITNGTTASSDNSLPMAGAVYVFKRTGINWAQEAYIKAPNADPVDWFGYSVSLSGDTAVVGAMNESSNQATITNGTTASNNDSLGASGAAYVFKRSGTIWTQEAYLKPPSANVGDNFGNAVAIFGDTVVVGAHYEDSNQTTITNGTTASSDNTATNAGGAYVFKRTGTQWAQEAYLKAPNAGVNDNFGNAVAIFGDTVVVGAHCEDSNQTTITNGTTASGDNTAVDSGAVYVFKK